MKKLFALIAMMAMCGVIDAQEILGDSHAMMCLKQGQKLLLLPVQEKEENANLAVLNEKNEVVKRLNVRLAVDRVDYYVPLELKTSMQLIDITFHGDRRQTGAVKDFACWKEMKYSDTFDTANRERFRPLYHHTPLYGWMNDPNGMFYKDGTWHLYYQYNPYGSQWENMTWGHSTSTDLLHWEAQPLAIEPDGLGTVFSGSCVVDGNSVVAFYTSAGQHQVQSTAVSHDNGQTFEKYAQNPIITSDQPDFRDPKVFWFEELRQWNLILAAGQEMHIYSSKDLKTWKFESSFGKGLGCHDGVWECPDLMKLGRKWLLICNINPGGPMGGSATQYFVGQFDGHRFACEHTDTRWMDYGKDHYATVTFGNVPEGRKIALAWMSNWQYANQVPTKQFRSANSVPRDLGLFDYMGQTYCAVTPSKELLSLRGQKVKQPTKACEIVVDLKNSAEITLQNAKGEQVLMRYDSQKQTFSMDRTKSGDVSFSEAFPCTTTSPVMGTVKQLRIFVDACSIEAFDAEGRMAMTNLVFPSEPYNIIKVKGGKATIYDLSK